MGLLDNMTIIWSGCSVKSEELEMTGIKTFGTSENAVDTMIRMQNVNLVYPAAPARKAPANHIPATIFHLCLISVPLQSVVSSASPVYTCKCFRTDIVLPRTPIPTPIPIHNGTSTPNTSPVPTKASQPESVEKCSIIKDTTLS